MLILMCLKQGKGKFGLVLVFPFLGKEGEVGFFSAVEKSARNNLYPVSCYSYVALKWRNHLTTFLLPAPR